MLVDSFIPRLKQFARSVDIITEEEVKDIASNVVAEYLVAKYSAKVFAILEQYYVRTTRELKKREAALRTFYTMTGPEWNQLILSANDDRYTGQVSYAFDRGMKMWVQCSDETPLGTSQGETYVDFWSSSENIPQKMKDNDFTTSTAIYIPLNLVRNRKKGSDADQKLGIMIVEFQNVVSITDELKYEFNELAAVFSILYALQSANQVQRNNTSDVISEMKKIALQTSPAEQTTPRRLPEDLNKRVFVIHGRNLIARDAMFSFLRKIGLYSIEWHEALQTFGRPNAYIMNIINSAFDDAQAVIVLLTGDDETRLRERFWREDENDYEKQYQFQARPNVLFEAGLAYGRYQDRTVIVQVGNVKPFSDIDGLFIIKILRDSAQIRKQIAQRLKLAGCSIRLEGDDWLASGEFDTAIQEMNGED